MSPCASTPSPPKTAMSSRLASAWAASATSARYEAWPQIDEMAQRAVQMLTAPQVKGGEYTVVLDPILAGVFVHEAFGHLSESDFVYENDRMREIMTLGKEFGDRQLNIVDSAAEPGLRGSFKYDDEGVPATKTYLIREGKLAGGCTRGRPPPGWAKSPPATPAPSTTVSRPSCA